MSAQTLAWVIYAATLVILLSITFIVAFKTDNEVLFGIPLVMTGLVFMFGILICIGFSDAKYLITLEEEKKELELTIPNLEEWQVEQYKLKIEKYEKQIKHQKKYMSVNDIEKYNSLKEAE